MNVNPGRGAGQEHAIADAGMPLVILDNFIKEIEILHI